MKLHTFFIDIAEEVGFRFPLPRLALIPVIWTSDLRQKNGYGSQIKEVKGILIKTHITMIGFRLLHYI